MQKKTSWTEKFTAITGIRKFFRIENYWMYNIIIFIFLNLTKYII